MSFSIGSGRHLVFWLLGVVQKQSTLSPIFKPAHMVYIAVHNRTVNISGKTGRSWKAGGSVLQPKENLIHHTCSSF